MKKDILLFACIEKNIGDDLFIETICSRYPQQTFLISDRANYGSLSKIPNLKFSKSMRLWQRFAGMEPTNQFKLLISDFMEHFFRYIIGRHQIGVEIVGNAFKNPIYVGKIQNRWIDCYISSANQFFLISTNFGPYKDERWVDDSRAVFERLTDICFRDSDS